MGQPLNSTIDTDFLSEEYRKRYSALERLALNIQHALKGFLDEAGIPYLDVTYRIKELPSFLEKIERKKYESPFEQCEDLCGIRVICYYVSDVDRISEIVQREFKVLESIDKAQELGVYEFGYRSVHFIATINKDWLHAPNYRGLSEVKAEIQIRTILMHAWAEVEHKLAYKKQDQVPDELQRKLSRLSAKFEEADEQFEEIRNAAISYQARLRDEAKDKGGFDISQELNLDSLQAFLDYYFPEKSHNSRNQVRDLLVELQKYKISFQDLVAAQTKAFPYLFKFEQAAYGGKETAQVGALRAILDIAHEGYFQSRSAKWKAGGSTLHTALKRIWPEMQKTK